eukprot:10638922-Lingulodinium_polyedra.AAC.1
MQAASSWTAALHKASRSRLRPLCRIANQASHLAWTAPSAWSTGHRVTAFASAQSSAAPASSTRVFTSRAGSCAPSVTSRPRNAPCPGRKRHTEPRTSSTAS